MSAARRDGRMATRFVTRRARDGHSMATSRDRWRERRPPDIFCVSTLLATTAAPRRCAFARVVNRTTSPFIATEVTPHPVPRARYRTSTARPRSFGLHTQSVELRRNHRIDAESIRFAREPEKMPHDQPERDARAARVDAPAAVERNRATRDALVLCTRLISVFERRVRARVIAICLPQRGARHDRADPDRHRLAQRMKEPLRIAHMRERAWA